MPVVMRLLLGLATTAMLTGPALGFQLSPEGSFIERKLSSLGQTAWDRFLASLTSAGVDKFGKPVHEEITNRILGCEGDPEICSDPQYDPANAYFLAGVRWNDDPPFRFERGQGLYSGCVAGNTIRLTTSPECWINVFLDGKKRAARLELTTGKDATLLLRSHFGDLQFLHAMASREAEVAEETRDRILMWAEFTWSIAIGDLLADIRLADLKILGMKDLFGGKGWDIQDLFALGNPHIRKQEYMRQVAFGSLLHLVQDSFSASHVSRRQVVHGAKCPPPANQYAAPGRIKQFHTYFSQDSKKHAVQDDRAAFSRHWSSGPPTVVEIGRNLYELFNRQERWSSVKPYVECIFALAPDAERSSPGDAFKK